MLWTIEGKISKFDSMIGMSKKGQNFWKIEVLFYIGGWIGIKSVRLKLFVNDDNFKFIFKHLYFAIFEI